MSIDYSAVLGVGYQIDYDDLEALFQTKTERVTHWEDRFDTHTGEPATPELVVDQEEYEVFRLPQSSRQHEDLESLLDELCERVDAQHLLGADYWGSTTMIMICPHFLIKDVMSVDHLDVQGSLTFSELVALRPKLDPSEDRPGGTRAHTQGGGRPTRRVLVLTS